MGSSKKEMFTDGQNQMANCFRVLGHPARLSIIEFLLNQESCVCGDIVLEVGLAQATISQHLKELKNIGIIKGTISGTKTNYCIDAEKWNQLKTIMNSLFDRVSNCEENSCC